MGYAADFEEEGYGDEADFNIQSDADQMNFISSRHTQQNYMPLRRQNQNIRVRGRGYGRGSRPN